MRMKLHQKLIRTNREFESFIEDRIQSLPVNFCLEFLFLVGQKKNFYIWVGGATDVHSGQVLVITSNENYTSQQLVV